MTKRATDPIANLIVLHDSVKVSPTLLPASQKWLDEVLERWRRGEYLKDAFGITDSAAERRFRRDSELKEYSGQLSGGICEKSKQIAQEVAKIRQARRIVNPILTSINSVYPLPDSWKQIYNILMIFLFRKSATWRK